MLDPSILDPNVFQAAKAAGLENVEDMNHNGKLDIQDVALMKVAGSNAVTTPVDEPVK
jgi:hypothetical protein